MRRLVASGPAVCLLAVFGCAGGGYHSTTVSANGVPYRVYWNTASPGLTLDAGQTVSLSATATDSEGKGVTYSLAGPGTISLQTGSGWTLPSVTFTAASGLAPGTRSTLTATANVNSALTADFSIITNPAITFPAQTLPPMYAGKPYSASLMATPGTGTLTYVLITYGSLPAGLSLSRDGVISGTPTAVGPYSFEIQVQDQSNSLGAANQKFTGTVD